MDNLCLKKPFHVSIIAAPGGAFCGCGYALAADSRQASLVPALSRERGLVFLW